ncbi:MAG TPA: YHS domain-containing (seleno)protein [Thermoanaerobaculia bacterium]|nr:YHS domain-containing (seleno)protein [Thermoanaerobaculia bacterium]
MKRTLAALLLAFLTLPLFATDPINKNKDTKVAIEGYDVVAYFTDGKAIEGAGSFQMEWQGASWRFASAAHRDAFAKNPRQYAPQYGGYCAFGVSRGYAVGIDPEAWHIVDGKLYLNYNKDVQKEWLTDIPGHVKKADRNWPKILAE